MLETKRVQFFWLTMYILLKHMQNIKWNMIKIAKNY